MTIIHCEGAGQYSDHVRKHIGDNKPFADINHVIIQEILVDNFSVEQVVELIRDAGRTGYRGDGMIIVSQVENVYKIRTDEEGIHSV